MGCGASVQAGPGGSASVAKPASSSSKGETSGARSNTAAAKKG
eukprot:CAMPEP_0177784766 /NCGR_PEP_ID=MMETSP0491_2-20121128/19908_1 /TAXON_ID=63592 /ORGANISM="Tetraselmis chuii, Strain PLY429" /LENGTH=42 /DNA_ID= /DNA_START= /DNA_END= /DNA_ORIENTATION=